jgi:replicative DNA helicase Mcm
MADIRGTYGPDRTPYTSSSLELSKSIGKQLSGIPVHDALRSKPGRCVVDGMITTMSSVYKMILKEVWICQDCNTPTERDFSDSPSMSVSKPEKCACKCKNFEPQHEYINALTVEIKDKVPKNELESLPVILFDKDTDNVMAGEIVTVTGHLDIVQDKRKGRMVSMLKATGIKYHQREEITLTDADIQAFKKFAAMPGLMDRLISMTAIPVIGHDAKKKGILRSAVGGPENSRRGRIHTLFVGDPGTAKTMLARESVKLVLNSRFVTSLNASGKSLTAIIDKESDNTTLRLGPVPLAKGSICAINEIGLMMPSDQNFLLDVMEEGKFTIDKYGIHAEMDSPTTIIGTTNQLNAEWSDEKEASKNEIPVGKAILDRFDQVYVFRDSTKLQEAKDYAYKKAEMEERNIHHNHNFVKKYLQFARTIEPRISPEARNMINEYWIGLKVKAKTGNRTLDGLVRIAKAQARLQLKELVDVPIAREVIKDYNAILEDYGKAISEIEDPRQVAYKAFLFELKAAGYPVAFEELALSVCEKTDYEQVKHYILGDTKIDRNTTRRLKLRNNYKLRTVLDMLLNHSSVKEVQQKPVIIQWIDSETPKLQ